MTFDFCLLQISYQGNDCRADKRQMMDSNQDFSAAENGDTSVLMDVKFPPQTKDMDVFNLDWDP